MAGKVLSFSHVLMHLVFTNKTMRYVTIILLFQMRKLGNRRLNNLVKITQLVTYLTTLINKYFLSSHSVGLVGSETNTYV